MTRINKNCLNC